MDEGGHSPPLSGVHQLQIWHNDEGSGHESMTKTENFWVLNRMLCEKISKGNNINPAFWKKTEPARMHRCMEPHNRMIDCQTEEAQHNADDNARSATPEEKCNNLDQTSHGTGAARSLEFKHKNEMTWDNLDKECLDEVEEDKGEEEDEETAPPHSERARHGNL